MMHHSVQFLRISLTVLLCAVAPMVFASSLDMPEADKPGAKDHPLITRFAGAKIAGYQSVDYDRLLLPMGKEQSQKLAKTEEIEGKITRIFYLVPENKSALEIFRNYQQALISAGFHARFECDSENSVANGVTARGNSCGNPYDFIDAVTHPFLDALGAYNEMLKVRPIEGEAYSLTARLNRPEGIVDVSVTVAKGVRELGGVFLQIAEHQPMATGQVTVDAKAIGEGLAQTGHIALYGLTFANDSATLDAASQPTLAQMAQTLTGQPALKVYIVGHTDATGNLAHNLDLSQRRAEAVVAALVKDYHIAPARLAAKGLASYAPVASNGDDAGRARNRRVEMVLQ